MGLGLRGLGLGKAKTGPFHDKYPGYSHGPSFANLQCLPMLGSPEITGSPQMDTIDANPYDGTS